MRLQSLHQQPLIVQYGLTNMTSVLRSTVNPFSNLLRYGCVRARVR